jgi:membrane-associated phospholipid phosphatase
VSATYLALTAVPLAAGGVAGGRALVLLAHVAALVTIVAADLRRGAPGAGAWTRVVSDLHLLALIPALYAELPLLMDGMPGAVVYHDVGVQSLEAVLFGFHPAWELAGRLSFRPLSEVLHLAYLLYYPIIYVPPLILYAVLRRGAHRRAGGLVPGTEDTVLHGVSDESEPEFVFARATLALALSMMTCYVAFVVWPVQGPRYLAAPEGVPEGPIRALVLTILQGGSSRGAAFPSSHVAVAVTQSLVMLRHRPRVGVAMCVVSLLLAAGAVYGGFHYAVDALAGAAVGIAAWLASGPVMSVFRRRTEGFAGAPGRV